MVDLELDVGEQTLARVLAVADEVLLVRARVGAIDDRAVFLDVVVRVAYVHVTAAIVGSGRDLGGARGRLIGRTNVTGEGRDVGVGSLGARDGIEHSVHYHVMKLCTLKYGSN